MDIEEKSIQKWSGERGEGGDREERKRKKERVA
jgi:hypothetical protein